jgi:anti-anti-sigma factor
MLLAQNCQPRGVIVAHFTGSKVMLNEETVYDIYDQLLDLVHETNEPELLLDFSNVAFITSSALDLLVILHLKLLEKGRSLIVGNLGSQIHEVFITTGLNWLLNLRLAETELREVKTCRPDCILVVDDDIGVLSVMTAFLKRDGFGVLCADHSHQAIESFHRNMDRIAAVLLDVQMPGIDGPHTLMALRKLSPSVQCCFMTGDPGLYGEQSLLELGAARIFRKPFAFTEVIDALNQLGCCASPRRQDRWIEVAGIQA